MAYELTQDDALNAVILVHRGGVSMAELKEARQASADRLRALQWQRLIVDLTGRTTVPSTVEQFDFSAGHHNIYPLGTRSAVIVTPESYESLKFAENVAINRGMQTKFFTELDDARAWLKENS
jgi:hypothetical protein